MHHNYWNLHLYPILEGPIPITIPKLPFPYFEITILKEATSFYA